MNVISRARSKMSVRNVRLPGHVNARVRDDVFKRYTKVKYLLRVRHWRGHDVHSPFTYNLVREALMSHRRNRDMHIDPALKRDLGALGLSESRIGRIGRVYGYLGFNSYAIGAGNYDGEEMLVLPEEISGRDLDELAGRIVALDKRVCVVMTGIYATTTRHSVWHHILRDYDAVCIDLYHLAFVIFDRYLSKQSYKMRF